MFFLFVCFFFNISLTLYGRAQRVGTTNHPVRKGKTSCHLTRSRSRGRGRGRDSERGRWEKWRDAGSSKIPALSLNSAARWRHRNTSLNLKIQNELFDFSVSDRDRDNRSERERIRLFREKEERKHLMKKRRWLEVLSHYLHSAVVLF